jgi:hypothetical protein
LIAAAVPVLLVVSLYAKNKVLFGHFAASTWTGMSLGHLTIDPLPREEAERLVAAGTLSPASAHPAFARARVYQGAYFDPPPVTRVRALYWEEKTTGAPNYNHAAYIRISRTSSATRSGSCAIVRGVPGLRARGLEHLLPEPG